MNDHTAEHQTDPSPPPLHPRLGTSPAAMEYARPPKSPGLALLLSVLFPGAGQIYNGQPAKAFVFFFGVFGSIYATATVEALPYAFLIPFVFIYSLIDAWRSAVAINARAAGGAIELEEDGFESPAWGAGLVAIGTLLLLNNLGWLRLASLQRYWPLLLIAAGGAFIYNSVRRRNGGSKARRGVGDDATEA